MCLFVAHTRATHTTPQNNRTTNHVHVEDFPDHGAAVADVEGTPKHTSGDITPSSDNHTPALRHAHPFIIIDIEWRPPTLRLCGQYTHTHAHFYLRWSCGSCACVCVRIPVRLAVSATLTQHSLTCCAAALADIWTMCVNRTHTHTLHRM